MKRLLFSWSLMTGLALSTVAATPPPEKLLPANTFMVFTVPDAAKARGVWDRSPSHQFLADPALKAFKEKFLGKFQSDLVAPLEKELGVNFSDYSRLAQGQITFALLPNGWDQKTPGFPGVLLVVDTRDQGGALKTNLAALKTKWVDSGKQLRPEKIRDVEFTALILKSGELKKSLKKAFSGQAGGNEGLENPKPEGEAAGGKPTELFVGQSDSVLLVGTSTKDLEKVLANQAGGSAGSLADEAAYSSSHGAVFREATAYGWVNIKSIVDVAMKSFSAEGQGQDRGGMKPDKIMAAAGLTGLQTGAFSLREQDQGWGLQFQLNVPEAGRRGLFKVLAHEAKDAAPPPFVPADVIKFSRWRLDLQKSLATLESALTEAVPQAAGFVKLIVDNAGKDKDPDFDLRKNLISNLGDDLISYEKAPRKQTLLDLASPPTLYLVGSPRAEQVASAIKALGAVMPQPKVKEREFLGRQVYALSMPPAQVPGGKQIERVLHYTATGGYVALSTDVAFLEEFMRNSDSAHKPLRDTPGLAGAIQKVGGTGTGLFGFENQQEEVRHAVETLRKESGSLANLFAGTPLSAQLGMGDDSAKFKEWVDFSLLPPFDQISKYFYISVFSGSVTPEGFLLKVYSPAPPRMKQ